jgi:HD-like signal output (HDOD) protein
MQNENPMTLDNPELSRELAAAVDSMPAFPKSSQAILALTQDVSCSPKDLVQIIEKDPIVTVKVLRVVNSAYYCLPSPISSIDHAVVFLGFNTIKNLALSISSMCMAPSNPMARFDGQRYLMHSLTTAGFAKKLAARVGTAEPSECYIAGLLHDFGKVVVAQFMPAKFRKALEMSLWSGTPLHLALRETVGVDDAAIGAMLAEKWRFPTNLTETIRHLHDPQQIDSDMMSCVFASNQISKHLGFDFGGSSAQESWPSTVLSRLGGDLAQTLASLGDLTPIIDEAKYFSKL